MTLPPSHQITVALFNLLSADAALKTLLPDGIWLSYALPLSDTQPRTRFGILELVPMVSRDIPVFGSRAIEERQYFVKAVTRDLSPLTANQAAHRMNELLEDVEIQATGYTWMTAHRLWPIEAVEPDEGNPKFAWQHRGGYYRVQYAVG
jgi:hypothetical protein